MPATFDLALVGAGALLIFAVLASRVSSFLGIPSLLAFVGIGMLAGSDGPGRIPFTDAALAKDLGTLALAFILFHGGMDTPWRHIRPVLGRALSLSTVGVAVTAGVVGAAAKFLMGYTWFEGLLLGSIVAATDAAAVFGTLRSAKIHLRDDVQGLIEAESGLNDPASVFLATGLTAAVATGKIDPVRLAGGFLVEMVVGAVVGIFVARVAVAAFRRLKLPVESLSVVLSIGFVLLTYGFAHLVHGNGFLAVYVGGLVVGNSEFRRERGLRRFHEAASWLMQVVMFLVLGLLVFPSHLWRVTGYGTVVAAVLTLVARPIGVFVSLAPFRIDGKAFAMLSWAGLRGAVPIVLATIPLLAGLPRAPEIFNVVFFVVLVSSLLQGTTLPWAAKRLGLLAAKEGGAARGEESGGEVRVEPAPN